MKINDDVYIDEEELVFTAERGGGPGGQNVNKVSTRVTLSFDVAASGSLTDEQKKLIMEHLSTRINKNGVLRVVSGKHRTQALNREQASKKFAELISDAFEEKPPRKKTRVPVSAERRRIEQKKKRGELKKMRKKVDI